MKIEKSMELKLSCYKCGGVNFENYPYPYYIIESMHFLQDENIKVKCIKCGLEDYIHNLVPRGIYHEELKEG